MLKGRNLTVPRRSLKRFKLIYLLPIFTAVANICHLFTAPNAFLKKLGKVHTVNYRAVVDVFPKANLPSVLLFVTIVKYVRLHIIAINHMYLTKIICV